MRIFGNRLSELLQFFRRTKTVTTVAPPMDIIFCIGNSFREFHSFVRVDLAKKFPDLIYSTSQGEARTKSRRYIYVNPCNPDRCKGVRDGFYLLLSPSSPGIDDSETLLLLFELRNHGFTQYN